jgi:beta-lactam-binding protein with PASTA domain
VSPRARRPNRRRVRTDEVPPDAEDVYPPGPPFEEPPLSRQVWPWLLLLAVLVVGGLAVAWAATRDDNKNSTTVTETTAVRIPDVLGQPESVAVTRLRDAGLKSSISRKTDTSAAGTVLDESPAAGSTVAPGSTVALVVSSGPKAAATVKVPNVVGQTTDAATRILAAAGLRVQTTTAGSDKPAGTVIAEAPTADSEVQKNSVVSITISKGPEQVAVPDVVGSTEEDARTALRSAGLLASVFRVPSDQAVGTVVAQDPKGGERVAKGSRVRVNVSEGATQTKTTTTSPATATVPDVVGRSQNQARHTLKDAGLLAAVAYVHGDVRFDQVVAQFPAAGATAKQGDRVRINVSLGPNPKPLSAVPDVTSEDEKTASKALHDAGFKIEKVKQDTTDPSADHVVLDQDPAAGTAAPQRSTVTIYVGKYSRR